VRLVLDTNVVVAGMRSPSGASAALLMAARHGKITMLANVALALEYEATCFRAEHGVAAGLKPAQIAIFIDAVIAMTEPVESHFLWRPQLRDPADELVLEAAVNGRAAAIVTFNELDFGAVPMQFGVEVLRPANVLRRIRKLANHKAPTHCGCLPQ
jgi:putative PIN family toxin of toxin-antitoxin system